MQITLRQLRMLIRESLTQFDPGGGPPRSYRAEPAGAVQDHADYRDGTQDAKRGVTPPEDASDEYQAGYDSARQEW